MGRFEGKVALITGAAQGIGLAAARRLVEGGARVVGADVNPRTAEILPTVGAKGVVADISAEESVEDLLGAVIAAEGRIDILVNNAGVTSPADFLDYPIAEFERVMRINVLGALMLSQRVARLLVARDSPGVIVNVSSINGEVAIPKQTAYVASKGALNQLTKVMAVSLAEHGIRVNAVAPGTIATEMSRSRILATEDSRRRMMLRTPLGRAGEVDEVASVIAFLASDEASYITGEIINIDGGRLALNGVVDSVSL
jgi:glucose 1-dehydrogenase